MTAGTYIDVVTAYFSYDATGELTRKAEWEYDSNGNNTKKSRYNASGLTAYDIYTYSSIRID